MTILTSLETIFKILSDHNLKIQADKCNFIQKDTKFLGHTLTKDGIKPYPTKVEDIKRSGLLGITGFYKKFIRDYAKNAYPLIK